MLKFYSLTVQLKMCHPLLLISDLIFSSRARFRKRWNGSKTTTPSLIPMVSLVKLKQQNSN